MPNSLYIDLLVDHTAGDIETSAQQIRSGANGLFLSAVLDGATVALQIRPQGGEYWYEKSEGAFTNVGVGEYQAWENVFLAEGQVRAVVTGATVNTVIHEFLLRPTVETELEV